jgi:hypothetical protein
MIKHYMNRLVFILAMGLMANLAFSQSKSYFSYSGEIILSLAEIDDNGNQEGILPRFSPFYCAQSTYNYDFSNGFGSFVGLAIRNIGFIYDQYEVPADAASSAETKMVKKKFRNYNIGLPVGFKIGKMDSFFLFGGYEIELPINYKEKTFDGDVKEDKFNVWFSDRVELFQHGFFAGVQLPYGSNLKFKYYLSNFHNTDFVNNDGLKPYEGLNANVFYFALSFSPFSFMND